MECDVTYTRFKVINMPLALGHIVKWSKISKTFHLLFPNKMFVRLKQTGKTDQIASEDLGLHCLSSLFGWQQVLKFLGHLSYM